MKLQFKPLSNPILIISDAPECLTGLARIGRDLASLLSTLPEYRVGYLGRGGVGRRSFPWMQYQFPVHAQWGEEYLPRVWKDFAGSENGIVFSLWDASRMLWFANPVGLPDDMQRFLGPGRNFEKWGYFPVDGTGPDGKSLPLGMRAAVNGYDRVLAASEWGRGVLHAGGRGDADWIPHGLWMDQFRYDGPVRIVKNRLGLEDHDIHVGCVMTNQSRKDWPVAFHTAALLRAHYGNRFHFWAHSDVAINYWNLFALASEYGVRDCTEFTSELTDAQLALRYSACDCTILPSAAEGFGFPVAESMACGTPCIVTDYAAAPELVEPMHRAPTHSYRIDTQHNVMRAVLDARPFADRAVHWIEEKRKDWEGVSVRMRAGVDHLNWEKLKVVWQRWLLEGVKTCGA